jgi:ATP adenylyltransferase
MPADPLWAPWRMQYILNDLVEKPELDKPSGNNAEDDAEAECFLCRAAKTDDWQAAHLLDRTDRALAVLNLYPYNNGHLLIAPLDHLARLDEIPAETQTEIMDMITRMTVLLERLMKPDGFNIGVNLGRVAGAGLPGHLHWHVVPRWNGDTNFMPVCSDTNVIPQSLDTLWKMVRIELEKC